MLCNEQIDECALNPCVNGTCHDKVNGFECECLPGFTGVKCEININECESNPCQNEATCYDFDNRYECKCVAGYEGKNRIFKELFQIDILGKNCEFEIDECLSNPCQNHGICTDKLASYSCRCFPGTKVT